MPTIHTGIQLRLANACHPSMGEAERRRILRSVAAETGDAHWTERLRRTARADRRVAMVMLDEYESGRRRHGHAAGGIVPALLLVLVLIAVLAVFMRT